MGPDPDLLTYLTDALTPGPGQSPPRAGDAVELRRARDGAGIEA